MGHRAYRVVAAALLCIALFGTHASATACPVWRGEPIVLASEALDPDVFLWDSRDRLLQYGRGEYTVKIVLQHTMLVRAYTRAVVVVCQRAGIRADTVSAVAAGADAVAVRLLAGAARGRYGWVFSTDVRRADGSVPSPARP